MYVGRCENDYAAVAFLCLIRTRDRKKTTTLPLCAEVVLRAVATHAVLSDHLTY